MRNPHTAPRWVRALLHLYPPDFRRALGADLLAAFVGERRAARRAGRRAETWFLMHAFAGMAWGALAERRRERRRRKRACTKRRQTGGIMFESWARELVRSGRSLIMRSPVFTGVAVTTIALGVGANTTVFSVVDGVLLRPLPFPEPEELVQVWEVFEQGQRNSVAGSNFLDWQEQSETFETLVARTNPAFGGPTTILGAEEPVRAEMSMVTEGFFEMMGVQPERGRALTDADYAPDAATVAVVSNAFWTTWLGRTEDLGGRTLSIGSAQVTVVGVMPAGFSFPDEAQLWIPLVVTPGSRTSHNWVANGRLRDGVSVRQATTELANITARLKAEYGSAMNAVSAVVVPLREELYGDLSRPLKLLLGAAGFVLLVACTNLASTLLARGQNRDREMAVRAALGASRLRIARQLLSENLLIAVMGATAGIGVAAPALRFFVAAGRPEIAGRVQLDARVFFITFTASVITVLAFGLLPAVFGTRAKVAGTLREGGRTGSGRSSWVWGFLVATEAALALTLLAGSAVLMRSFARVLSIERGFETEQVLTAALSFPSSLYPDDATRAAVQKRTLEAIRAVPGVEAAGLVNHLPLSGVAYNGGFEIEGNGPVRGAIDYRIASTGYLEAMGIPLLDGRDFEAGDDASTGDVALVSLAAAGRFWPGESPVGRRIRNLANDSWLYPDRWITIVGVVGDVRHRALTVDVAPTVYVHSAQRPARAGAPVIAIRTRSASAAALQSAVREAVHGVDAQLPTELTPMTSLVSDSETDRRFNVLVLSSFAVLALGLAAVGIYGVVSYTVARRTRETGIRIALGAERSSVRRLVVGGSMRPVVLGVAFGVGGAFYLGRLLAGMVYEVRPTDPLSLTAATLLMLGVAFVASWIPAARATRVDPVVTMRAE